MKKAALFSLSLLLSMTIIPSVFADEKAEEKTNQRAIDFKVDKDTVNPEVKGEFGVPWAFDAGRSRPHHGRRYNAPYNHGYGERTPYYNRY